MSVRLSSLSEYMDYLHSLRIKFPAKNFTAASFEWGWPKEVHEKGLYPFNYTNESTQFQTGCLTSHGAHKQHSRRVAVRVRCCLLCIYMPAIDRPRPDCRCTLMQQAQHTPWQPSRSGVH